LVEQLTLNQRVLGSSP